MAVDDVVLGRESLSPFLREILCSSYFKHKTKNWVRSKINCRLGAQEPFLATVKRRKLAWFGHVTHHDSFLRRLGGRASSWLAQEMLKWTTSLSDIPAHARTAHNGLL